MNSAGALPGAASLAASATCAARMADGLQGQWIHPYWLWLTVQEAGGRLGATVEDGLVSIAADLPDNS